MHRVISYRVPTPSPSRLEFKVHTTSLVPAGEPESNVQPVLSGILEPLLKACRLSCDGLDPSDGAVFMLNNIDVVREALLAHGVGWWVMWVDVRECTLLF